MIGYNSFLPPKTAGIAEKLDNIKEEREKLHSEYVEKPVSADSLKKYIEEDFKLYNLEMKYHNELVSYLKIKVSNYPNKG